MEMLQKMFQTHPNPASSAGDTALRCAYECVQCAMVCTSCADACLAEETVSHLSACIRLNQDCADVCGVTARMIARASHGDTASLRAQLQACRTICTACRDECRKHGEMGMQHCSVCAECCDTCARVCGEMIEALVP